MSAWQRRSGKDYADRARNKARKDRQLKRAELMVLLQFRHITMAEYTKQMGEIGKFVKSTRAPDLAPVIDPKCPRCAELLVKLECPPGMSIANWCHMRKGDFHCPNCVKLQAAGRLSLKARTTWFASFFRKKAK